MAPFFKCCWAAAMSWLWGKSLSTCSRTQPPGKILVFESPNRHFKFGTTPESVPCSPRFEGFAISICRSVPPREISAEFLKALETFTYPRLVLLYLCRQLAGLARIVHHASPLQQMSTMRTECPLRVIAISSCRLDIQRCRTR
jgi:hypothetical protein